MYALIKREIRDHRIFFLGAVVLTVSLIGLSVTALYNNRQIDAAVFGSGGGVTALVIVVFGLFAMGSVQMYTDRIRKISAFVSTLPVSRSRILLAKICAGILAILIVLVPLAVAVSILLQINAPPVPMYWAIARDVFAGTLGDSSRRVRRHVSRGFCLLLHRPSGGLEFGQGRTGAGRARPDLHSGIADPHKRSSPRDHDHALTFHRGVFDPDLAQLYLVITLGTLL